MSLDRSSLFRSFAPGLRTSLSSLALCGLLSSSCIQRDARCGPDGAASTTAAASPAASPGTPLPPGTSLLGPTGIDAFQPQGEVAKVDVRNISVEGQPFPRAIHAEIKQASGSEWTVQVQAKTAVAIDKGDVVLASFYVRSVKAQESGTAETQFVFERAGDPYTKSVSYSLKITPEWRKVQVRFVAAEAYPAGSAQMIFRLGYEPEIIEIGGVTVDSYGKKVAISALPTTELADRKLESATLPKEEALPVVDGGALAFQVTPAKVIRAISPHVYGINAQTIDATGTTARRLGGNRGTVYNWEINASNAGNDYRHVNDDWPCTVMGYQDCGKPGAQQADFVKQNKDGQADSVIEIPMIDYVSADKNQDVKEDEKAPSKRFVRSYPKKKGAFTLTPDLNDGAVYQDELVNFLVQKFGKAAQGGAKFYSLDNEPALWPSTHPRVHGEKTTYREMVQRSEATASAILDVDPTATVLGGVMYGWNEYQTLQSAPDSAEFNAKYGSYVDYYLASLKELEQKHGKRLVHALDVHWYPESRGTKRITEDDTSRKTIAARLQAPRSLWDSEYKEASWITDKSGKPIRLIPWLLETIAKRYPGTKLAMTEYNFGAGNHISGGLAQADVLGILGREGVMLGNYWGNGPGIGDLPPFISAAFKLYRNYDGKGGRFGDTAIAATTSNLESATIYAATDSKRPGIVTVVIINKDQQKNFHARVGVDGAQKVGHAEAYVLDGSKGEVRPAGAVPVTGNKLEYLLPPLSAVLLVLDKG
jgi:hypothetical protein